MRGRCAQLLPLPGPGTLLAPWVHHSIWSHQNQTGQGGASRGWVEVPLLLALVPRGLALGVTFIS